MKPQHVDGDAIDDDTTSIGFDDAKQRQSHGRLAGTSSAHDPYLSRNA